MRKLNIYITEKLHINKDIKIELSKEERKTIDYLGLNKLNKKDLNKFLEFIEPVIDEGKALGKNNFDVHPFVISSRANKIFELFNITDKELQKLYFLPSYNDFDNKYWNILNHVGNDLNIEDYVMFSYKNEILVCKREDAEEGKSLISQSRSIIIRYE